MATRPIYEPSVPWQNHVDQWHFPCGGKNVANFSRIFGDKFANSALYLAQPTACGFVTVRGGPRPFSQLTRRCTIDPTTADSVVYTFQSDVQAVGQGTVVENFVRFSGQLTDTHRALLPLWGWGYDDDKHAATCHVLHVTVIVYWSQSADRLVVRTKVGTKKGDDVTGVVVGSFLEQEEYFRPRGTERLIVVHENSYEMEITAEEEYTDRETIVMYRTREAEEEQAMLAVKPIVLTADQVDDYYYDSIYRQSMRPNIERCDKGDTTIPPIRYPCEVLCACLKLRLAAGKVRSREVAGAVALEMESCALHGHCTWCEMPRRLCFCGFWLDEHRCRHCKLVLWDCECDINSECKRLMSPPA
jgi:hypothetical protein